MSYGTGRISGKGGANVECPVCGFVWKNFDMKMRWDQKLVCRKCWEMRHPLDFYRPLPDVYRLPFTHVQSQETTYTPVFTNLTQTPGTGSIIIKGVYTNDNSSGSNVQNVHVTINSQFPATTSNSGGTMTLPQPAALAGTWRCMDGLGTLLGSGTINGADTAINPPSWVTTGQMITITAQYGI